MRIELADPAAGAERLRSCHQIAAACGRADDPGLPARSLASFALWARSQRGNPRQLWLATQGDVPVGCYLLRLPELDNPAIASCALYVAPGARRCGHGTGLLAHCAGQARQAGRSRLAGWAREGAPGAAFAAVSGARGGITEVYRRLVVDAALHARLPALRTAAEQRSGDAYGLVSWRGVTPDEHLDDVVAVSAAMADAPRDAGVEPEVRGAGRIRSMEEAQVGSGARLYGVAARHNQTGRLTAVTEVATDPGTAGWALQGVTAVLPAHRGHRLGLLVKVAMLELLTAERPDVDKVLTSNAGSNQYMIAINEQFGFEVCSVHRRFELDLTAARRAAPA